MNLKEIIESFKENSFQTLLYENGWFITGIKEERNGYIIRGIKWIKEVNQSIGVSFYCSSSIIENDEGTISKILDNKLKEKIDERKKIEESNKRPG